MLLQKSNISYCGLDCKSCILNQNLSPKSIKDSPIPSNQDLESLFPNGNNFDIFLSKLSQQFGHCEGCVNSSGFPNCLVHKCAQAKGFATCAECSELEHCALIKADFWKLPILLNYRK
ncbi:MAG: DUF3795 domain-containing protein [Asgard group archaeon]|nr:DUF3795 domain-containing protein [Asgard group archaeon]